MSTQSTTAIQGITVAPSDSGQTGLQSSYFGTLQSKADSQIGAIYNISVTPVSEASVGGFNYVWENSSLALNLGTYNYVNGRVVPGAGPAVSITDSLANDYAQLLRTITFQYSAADAQAINQAATNANSQATSVVSQYTSTYGPITSQMMTQAGVTTPIDYVINYVVAQVWSGTAAAKQLPLSLTQMEQARDLGSLLPALPASGADMLPLISTYLGALSSVLPLLNQKNNALSILRVLIANTETPSASNGGITTVDPNNGSTATHVGYTVNSAVAQIENDLANTGRTLSVSMSTSQSSSSTVQVSMSASGGFEVPVGWFLGLGGSGGASSNMYSAAGTGTSASVELTFAGFTYVPVTPVLFQEDTLTGWFNASVIGQAARNFGKDATGYTFLNPPQWNLGEGGEFGVLKGVVIANFPTVTINYQTGDWSQFSQQFEQHSSWNVSFLGIPVASFSESSYQATAQANSESGGFSVTFKPSPEILSVPDLQKQAYVIGCTVGYPGTGNL